MRISLRTGALLFAGSLIAALTVASFLLAYGAFGVMDRVRQSQAVTDAASSRPISWRLGRAEAAQCPRSYSVLIDLKTAARILQYDSSPPATAADDEVLMSCTGRDAAVSQRSPFKTNKTMWLPLAASAEGRALWNDVANNLVRYMYIAGSVVRVWVIPQLPSLKSHPVRQRDGGGGGGGSDVLLFAIADVANTEPVGECFSVPVLYPFGAATSWDKGVALLLRASSATVGGPRRRPTIVWAFGSRMTI